MQGGGEAVGRIDAVVTRIEVLAEQLLVAEAVFRRIEVGQVVLRLGGNVVIKQARFQRLDKIIAEQTGLPLEGRAGIDVEDRQGAADGTARGAFEVIQVIKGVMHAEFRADKTPFVVQVPAHAGIEHRAVARLFAVVVKTGELAEQIYLCVADVFVPGALQTRQDGIGFIFIAVNIGQCLVFLYDEVAIECASPQGVVVIEPNLAVEVNVGCDVVLTVEVAVVVVVGNAVIVDAAAELRSELLVVV